MAGPLTPQCVMSRGPSVLNLVPARRAVTLATTMPIRLLSGCASSEKLNSDGTGGTVFSCKGLRNAAPSALGLPPVVTITASEETQPPFAKLIL